MKTLHIIAVILILSTAGVFGQAAKLDLPKLFVIKNMTADSASSYLLSRRWALTKTGGSSENVNMRYRSFDNGQHFTIIIHWDELGSISSVKDVCYLDFVPDGGKSYVSNLLWLTSNGFEDSEFSYQPSDDENGVSKQTRKYYREEKNSAYNQAVLVEVLTTKGGAITAYAYTVSREISLDISRVRRLVTGKR